MSRPIVFLVDDDRDLCDSLTGMLTRTELRVEAFSTPADLLEAYDPTKPGCLVLDLCLPQMNGLELHEELSSLGCQHPFIVISGHGEIAHVNAAMRMGAVDFVEKPFDHKSFLMSVWRAINRDRTRRRQQAAKSSVQARLDALTHREHQVLQLVVAGKLSRQIADRLQVATKTVDVHRSNIMRKMDVASLAQLVGVVRRHSSTEPRAH